jgi:NAD binding domain of 6-phosphogluconate dehydrogenase
VRQWRNLSKAGHRVTVYNRSRGKAEALARKGAQIADRVADACREIFSSDWWGKPTEEVLQACIARHRWVVLGRVTTMSALKRIVVSSQT